MKYQTMLSFTSLTIFLALSCSLSKSDTVNEVLKFFDLDFDDLVVEKGENWVEKYYIKNLKKCEMKMPDGYRVNMKSLAKNAPPDYTYVDLKGNKYYFNVCRNTIMTCKGRDDGIAV
jgi:hypothetical protein